MSADNPLLNTIWKSACLEIKNSLGEDAYIRHIEPLKAIDVNDGKITLEVDNEYSLSWIKNNYLGIINDAMSKVAGDFIKDVSLSVSETQEPIPSPEPIIPVQDMSSDNNLGRIVNIGSVNVYSQSNTTDPHSSNVRGIKMNAEYTFANFIVGPSNSFATNAAFAVANNPGTAYNPLFIYGDTGLGKTHLMQSIGQDSITKNNRIIVCNTTSEALLNDYLENLRNNTVEKFRKKYRSVDILLIDDIQFLAGKAALQEEFFHTFNTLKERGKQIVMTSDRPPKDIDKLEERLVSRFSQGLVCSVEHPSFETRLAILKQKHEQNYKVPIIPDTIFNFIAQNVESNVRQLEGALRRVEMHISLNNNLSPSIEAVRELLKDILTLEIQPGLTFNEIQKVVAEHYNLNIADMASKCRSQSIALPRQIAMYLCCALIKASLGEIGGAFGKTHATIIHATKTIKDRMSTDPDLKRNIEAIIKKLGRDPVATINMVDGY